MCDDPEKQNNFPMEVSNSQTPLGMLLYLHSLKKKSIFMLQRYLNTIIDLCNGTHSIIQDMGKHVFDAEIFTDDHSGQLVFIPHINLSPSEDLLLFRMTSLLGYL